MMLPKEEKLIAETFAVSLVLKGIFACTELLGGLLLFFASTDSIRSFVDFFTLGEVAEDPRDVVNNYIYAFAQTLTLGEKSFIALYLLAYGLVKLFFVVMLMKNKMWAYPTSLAVFGSFVLYQLYRYTHTHSAVLLILTVFDLLVMALIWHEYRLKKQLH